MKTVHVDPPSRCPNCGGKLDAASEVFGGNAAPRPDDLSVCIHCATMLKFNDDLTVGLLTRDEFAQLPQSESVALLAIVLGVCRLKRAH